MLALVMLAGFICYLPKDAKAKPPTYKAQCMNNGWMTFNNPMFNNQGQCIDYFSKTDLYIKKYLLNGVASNATLDVSSNSTVSVSITASEPAYWYRIWICKVDATNCGNSLFDGGGTVQYFFRTVPPYIETYISDAGQWDGKDYKGDAVPNGEYMIRVYIADESGNETRTTLMPYTVTVVNSQP